MANGSRRRRGGGPHGQSPKGKGKKQEPSGPSAVAAVPSAVRNGLDRHAAELAPGHAFYLYFRIWNPQDWESASENAKRDGLKQVAQVRAPVPAAELVERQNMLSQRIADRLFVKEAVSRAPFVTGLGMEHPVENGFAFLWPYGLPYLPGSSVKGALRRAAESLALEEDEDRRRGWDLVSIWWLFGFDATAAVVRGPEHDAPDAVRAWAEAERKTALEHIARVPHELFAPFADTVVDKRERHEVPTARAFLEKGTDPSFAGGIHNRGALVFWDVFPVPAEGSGLEVEILTPHHAGYYQGNNSPHSSENPKPNPFLVIEPGARFRFHVELRPMESLPQVLRQRWRELVDAAFAYLFQVAGFGAKTAVGYGVFESTDGNVEGSGAGRSAHAARRWVEETARELAKDPSLKTPDMALRSKPFAERWAAIEDEELKQQVLAYLREEVWSDRLRRPSKNALKIYGV